VDLIGQTLVFAGVAAAAAIASKIFRAPWDWGRAIAVLAVAFCAAMAIGHVTTAGRTLADDWRAGSHRSARQAQVLPGKRLGLNVPYIEWLRKRVPAHQTYYVAASSAGRSPLVRAWMSFRLLPRVKVAGPRQADWLVVYRAKVTPQRGTARAFGPITWFAPEYGIARRLAG
jgi:hypothetical protein